MKKVLSVLLSSLYIFFAIIPCTSVFATEVTWGDNNTYTISDSDYELFNKVAIISLIPDLLSSGINELSIENATDVDNYVDNIISYIETHADDFTNVNTWSALNDLNQALKEKTQEIGNNFIQNGGVVQNYNGTLSSFFEPQNNNTQNYKFEYKANPNFVSIFNRLSRINNVVPTPNPPNDDTYSILLRVANEDVGGIGYFWRNYNLVYPAYWVRILNLDNIGLHSYFGADRYGNIKVIQNSFGVPYATDPQTVVYATQDILTLNITSNSLGNVIGTIENINIVPNVYTEYLQNNPSTSTTTDNFYIMSHDPYWNSYGVSNYTFNSFYSYQGNSISDVLSHFVYRFHNINIYVDGELWSYVGSTSDNKINIDINGMELYGGTRKPVTYYYPNGTQIDYQKLYFVIKEAIDDLQPISMQTINEGDVFYDSHNNTYAPVIYNYYGDDDEDESSIIEDILTLAVIPEFDTALLKPLETPMLNGEKIMFTGVQAFPEEILFVLGACFVLVLFGAMINRLIE